MVRLSFTKVVLCLAAGVFAGAAWGAEATGQLETLQQAEQFTEHDQWPEAAAAWQRVVDVNPHLGRAWRNLGTARLHIKEFDKAIPAFAKALELGSGYRFDAACNIARCYAQLGDKQRALDWLQKSLDFGYRRLDQIREDKDLQPLKDDERFKRMAAVVDVSHMSRDEGWRYDLDLLAREIKRAHYSPFRKISRQEFDLEVDKLRREIPQLSDNQIMVGLRRIIRRVGDGHSGISSPHGPDAPKELAPVEFYLFAEGVFITSAHPRHADLAGAQVLRIGGHPVEEVVQALDQVIPQDNSMGLLWLSPLFLRYPRVLNGLGMVPDDKSLPMTVRGAQGKERDVILPADSAEPEPSWISARKNAPAPEPLYLKKQRDPYWFEYVPEKKLVYFQYNQVWEEGQKETIKQFSERLFKFIDQNDVARLVIDMRWNGGGNNFLNEPIVHGLIRCDKVNQKGKLFVIVGRDTFSAAMCGAAQIERETNAIFVGEPTGSSPNFVGESAVMVKLPYSNLRASISDLYWENSVAMDYRTWIPPQIYAPPTFAMFRANRDPAMEAILAYRGEKGGEK
jgi:tetratricopeptide (TPR) repeat protein